MSNLNPQSPKLLPELPSELLELTSLPPNDLRRRQLTAYLDTLTPEARRPWDQLLRETDLLHQSLTQSEVPSTLEAKLLVIPSQSRPAASKRFSSRSLTYGALIACLLIVVALAGWQFWPEQEAVKAPIPNAPQTSLDLITTLAVQNHINPPATEIHTDDLKTLGAALAMQQWPFPVQLLHPKEKFQLLGGGRCDFNSHPAAYTRWKDQTSTLTLYQFDGKDFNIPPQFASAQTTPRNLWQGDLHYRVLFWPGLNGKCTWALVLENDQTKNAFLGVY